MENKSDRCRRDLQCDGDMLRAYVLNVKMLFVYLEVTKIYLRRIDSNISGSAKPEDVRNTVISRMSRRASSLPPRIL